MTHPHILQDDYFKHNWRLARTSLLLSANVRVSKSGPAERDCRRSRTAGSAWLTAKRLALPPASLCVLVGHRARVHLDGYTARGIMNVGEGLDYSFLRVL